MPSSTRGAPSSRRRTRLGTWATAALALVPSVLAQVSLTPAPTINGMGNGVSPLLDATYMGIGIEPSNLLSFTGPGQPNNLTNKLLGNIAKYMGYPPHIRVGGNSGDNMLWDPSNKSVALERNPNAKGQGNPGSQTDSWTYGPAYYAALDNFPKHTPITFGLNLAYNFGDALDRIVEQAQSVFDNLKNVDINSLEVGNEPDLYIVNNYRPGDWSTQDFGNEWFERADAVYNKVLKPLGMRTDMFEAAATATTATKTGHQYRIAKLQGTGVGTDNGQYLRGWNQHDYYYYVGVSNFNLTYSLLLDLPAMTQQFTEWTNQAKQANATGKPYFIREMGSVGPTGIKGLSDTFANTLWTFNFFLFAPTVGVSSVQIHMTDNSYAAPWQPNFQNGEDAHVRSSYYAFAAMAQLLGTGCNTNIAAIEVNGVPDSYQKRIAAYGVYRHNTLQAIVLLNTNPYGPETQGAGAAGTSKRAVAELLPPEPRHAPHRGRTAHDAWLPQKREDAPTVTFTLSLPEHKGKTFYLSTLANEFAASTANTTWNGMEYESTGDGQMHFINGTDADSRQQKVTVGDDGNLAIEVSDSSIVVANLGVILGGDDGHKSLCPADYDSGNKTTSSGDGEPQGFTGTVKEGKPLSTTAIIAIAAGGGGGLALLAAAGGLIAFCCLKKRRSSGFQNMADSKHGKRDSLVAKASGLGAGLGMAGYQSNFAPSREGLLARSSHSDEYAMSDRPPNVRFATSHPLSSTTTLVPTSSSTGQPPKASDAGYGYGYNYDYPVEPVQSKRLSSGSAVMFEPSGYVDDKNLSVATPKIDTYDLSNMASPQLYHGGNYGFAESSDTLQDASRAPTNGKYGALPQNSPLMRSPLAPSPSDVSIYSRSETPVNSRALAMGQSDRYSGLGLEGVGTIPGHHPQHSYDPNADRTSPTPYRPTAGAIGAGIGAGAGRFKEPNPYATTTPQVQRPGNGPRGYNVHNDPAYASYARATSTSPENVQRTSRTLISPQRFSTHEDPSAPRVRPISRGRPISGVSGAGTDVGMAVGTALMEPGTTRAPRRGRTRELDSTEVEQDWVGPSESRNEQRAHRHSRSLSCSRQGSRQEENALRTVPSQAALSHSSSDMNTQRRSVGPVALTRQRSMSQPGLSRDMRDAPAMESGRGANPRRWDQGSPTGRSRARSGTTQATITRRVDGEAADTRAERQAYAEWYAQQYGQPFPPAAQAMQEAQAAQGGQQAYNWPTPTSPVRQMAQATQPTSPGATQAYGRFGGYPSQEAYNQAYYQYYAQYYQAQARAAAQGAQGAHAPPAAPTSAPAAQAGQTPPQYAHQAPYAQQQYAQQPPQYSQDVQGYSYQGYPPSTNTGNARDIVRQARADAHQAQGRPQ